MVREDVSETERAFVLKFLPGNADAVWVIDALNVLGYRRAHLHAWLAVRGKANGALAQSPDLTDDYRRDEARRNLLERVQWWVEHYPQTSPADVLLWEISLGIDDVDGLAVPHDRFDAWLAKGQIGWLAHAAGLTLREYDPAQHDAPTLWTLLGFGTTQAARRLNHAIPLLTDPDLLMQPVGTRTRS